MARTKTCRLCGESHECDEHAHHDEEQKQPTRLIKCACPNCGYVIRTTRKWMATGLPWCACETQFVVADGSDEK